MARKRKQGVDPAGLSSTGQAGADMMAMADFRDFSGSGLMEDETPKDWKDRAILAWRYYLEEPLVKNCINSWRAFSLGDEIKITCEKEKDTELIEEFAEEVNLNRFVKDMILQLLVKGDAIGYKVLSGSEITELVCVNPTSCAVKYVDGKLIECRQSNEEEKQDNERPLPLDQLMHLRWDSAPFSPRGNSMVLPAFESIALLREYRKAERAIAKRWSTPFRLIKVGGQFGQKLINPTQRDLNNLKELINKMDLKSGLVVPFYVTVETHGTDREVLKVEDKVKEVKEDIMVALGLSRSLVTGDGPNFATAMVSLRKMAVMIREIKHIAVNLCRWVIYDFCERKGIDADVQVIIDDLDPTDALDYKKVLLELYDRGVISKKTLQEKWSLEPDVEHANRKSEKFEIQSPSSVKIILDLVISGILTPEEGREKLNLSPLPSQHSQAAIAMHGGESPQGHICEECRHHDTAKAYCAMHEMDRHFGDQACRFFAEK